MIREQLGRLYAHLSQWTYVHLVISVYSFLILVCWGIPFCPMSFFGNLLFSPMLTLFLSLCTLLFFTELCSIPNQLIIWALDYISEAWLWLLQSLPLRYLHISCAQPTLAQLGALFFGTFIIILLKTTYTKKNIFLCIMLASTFIITHQQKIDDHITYLPCAQSTLPIIYTQEGIIIVDTGCLGRYISAPTFVQHTLLPHLIQKYGCNSIAHFIELQPGKLAFDAIQALQEKIYIQNIYIPYWQGTLSKSGLRSFMQLKHHALTHGTTMHRLQEEPTIITKSNLREVAINPLQEVIKKTSIEFPALSITSNIDKQIVTFYPAKYKLRNKTHK